MQGIEALKAQRDLCSQIMTLSTTAVAFTVTFLDKFRLTPTTQPLRIPAVLFWSWIAYIIAIIWALLTTMAIVGTMEAIERETARSSRSNIRRPAGVMIIAFVVAVALTIAAGYQAMNSVH